MDDLITPTAADPSAVSLGLLRRYLAMNKWRRADMPHTPPAIPERLRGVAASFLGSTPIRQRAYDVYVHSKPGQPDIEIVLPTGREDTTSVDQIESAVMKLAALERSSPERIIAAIRSVGFDCVFSRVPNTLVLDDSIHLDIAANHIRDMRNLLAANATTELAPTPFFPKLVKQATDYADNCRFAHTFKGSFGFTIESPLKINDEPSLPIVPAEAPFERRVIERFARGVGAVYRAAEQDDTKIITDTVNTGFSANACEQFANLIEDTSPGGMRIAFAFSPEWPVSPGLVLTREYEVGLKHIEVTRAAAKELRERPLPSRDTVTGLIFDLHSRNDPLGLFGGSRSDQSIVLSWRPEGISGEVRVTVRLSQDNYEKAVEAHRQGIPVTVKGLLEQRGARSWELSSITSFIVDDAKTLP